LGAESMRIVVLNVLRESVAWEAGTAPGAHLNHISD
jgi:hypothetical protein